jgi:4-hydroxybenzoate polyprenyltransferase
MDLVKFFRSDFGSDLAVKDAYNAKDQLTGYLTLARPLFLILTPLNAASAAVLSIRGLPAWNLCLAGFFTGVFAAAGVNIYNRYADRERDKALWPGRAIQTRRVSAGGALTLSLICYAASLALCWIYFNATTFFILFSAEVLGSLYSSFLRDKVGYMSLPLIEGLIFLCGWACLSPTTAFTTVLPWYLYLLGVVWQSAHITAHYALNIRPGRAMTPLLFSTPSPGLAARVALSFTALLFILSTLLPLVTRMSYLYFIPVAAYGLYTLYRCMGFFRDPLNKEKTQRTWSALATFRMVISAAIILSILVYH